MFSNTSVHRSQDIKRLLFPPLLIRHRVAKHLQKHALEQVGELLQVFFSLGNQSFHFAEQMGNADLVFKAGQ